MVLGVIGPAAPALAQPGQPAPRATPPNRISGPFAGLFGGGRAADNINTLDARASGFGIWQQVFVPDDLDPALLDPTFQRSQTFAGVSGSLAYAFARRTDNAQFTVGTFASVSDYSINFEQPQYSVGATVGLATALTRRIAFTSGASAAYSPYFSLLGSGAFYTGSTPTTGQDPNSLVTTGDPSVGFATTFSPNINTFGNVGLSGTLSRRTHLSADLSFQRAIFFDDTSIGLGQLSSSATLTHQFLRRLNFHLSYRRSQVTFADDDVASQPTQTLDAGVDYGDALSLQLTRRTTLSATFALGAARSVTTTGAATGDLHFVATGNVSLIHTMGRTWSTGASASRNLGFSPAFLQPVVSDTAEAFITGQLSRRVSWANRFTMVHGEVNFESSQSFNSYGASSNLSIGITRQVGAYVQYFYFHNRIAEGLSALPIASDFGRQAVVAGVNLYQPIFGTQRRTR